MTSAYQNTMNIPMVTDYAQSGFPYTGLQLNETFTTPLFRHQSECVEWMLYREEMPHENIRGGMILDDMGLGKTLCALSTIMINKGATLAVMPAQLVYNWKSEIERHFKDYPYYIYHGANRKKKFERYRLKNGDPLLIIMSYNSLPTDIEDAGGPLTNMTFHRIMYDECHYIKNQHTEVFKSLLRVKSPIKWFISGTPIMNKIQEMYPYLKLFNYKHISKVPQMVARGRNGYTPGVRPEIIKKQAYLDMQNLLKVVAIRRTKEILELPEKSFNDVYIDLNEKEREFYRVLQEYSRNRVKKLMRNIKRVQNSGLTPGQQNRLRVIILQCMLSLIFHLRIACCDPLLVIDKISRTKGLDMSRALVQLQTDTEDDCPICFNNQANVYNERCRHSACGECWKRLAKMEPMRCFTCMEETSPIHLRDMSVVNDTELKKAHDERIFHRSSKTRAILDLIKMELEKGKKIVVVSQWTSYLDLVMKQFKCETKDVSSVLLNGQTLPIKRQKIVDQFQDDPLQKVCFASLGSSAEGITLHSACSMILCDVYWNKARGVEQMSDRIHRIGQKNEVSVHCLYLRDSIEMKLKELIDKKDMICKVIVNCAPITETTDSWLTRMIRLMD